MPAADRDAIELEPLGRPALKDRVVQRLTRLIENGTLQPDQQLPSERELSDQLQVSRGTVREAVQFLHALGLVEIRHGSGTFVRVAADASQLRAQWRAWTVRHAGRVHDLLEVRKELESFAAELAAARISADGVDAIDDALAEMAQAVADADVPALVRSDVAFHHAVCGASGNAALVELTDALGGQLLRERGAIWDLPGRPERSLAEHREISDAIDVRDSGRARAAVLAHLRSVEADVNRLLDSQPPDERTTHDDRT
jgi:GntR family transcriptional repressor for pyruvate dehydrogenase complex